MKFCDSEEEWKIQIKAKMQAQGWRLDGENETLICFSRVDSEGEKWGKDYFISKRTFVHYPFCLNLKLTKDDIDV
jgi:hypothetical protein